MAEQGRPLSVRLDAEALEALEVLAKEGLTRSEAIRAALIEAAHDRRSRSDLDAEIQTVADDAEDRAVKAEITEFMEHLGDTW